MNARPNVLAALLVLPLAGCASIHETVETKQTFLASRTLSRERTPAPANLEVKPTFRDGVLEVTVYAVPTCVEHREDVVATDRITRREMSGTALGLEIGGIGLGAAMFAGGLLSAASENKGGECDTPQGNACGYIPGGVFVAALGEIVAVTAATILVVDRIRQHDSTDRVSTEAVPHDAMEACDRGPARGSIVELVSPVQATQKTDDGGVVRFPFEASYHGPVQLRIDGHDAPIITR